MMQIKLLVILLEKTNSFQSKQISWGTFGVGSLKVLNNITQSSVLNSNLNSTTYLHLLSLAQLQTLTQHCKFGSREATMQMWISTVVMMKLYFNIPIQQGCISHCLIIIISEQIHLILLILLPQVELQVSIDGIFFKL